METQEVSTLSSQAPFEQLLKHTSYYWIFGERARFKAETVKYNGFNCVMALFELPDRQLKIIRLPLNKGYETSEPIDFQIEYKNNAWYAYIRTAY